MKCNDCHVFLHRSFPCEIRYVLRKDVCETLTELSLYFKYLWSKTLCLETLYLLEQYVVL